MIQDNQNLAIHINHLTKENLTDIRYLLQWYSENITHVHNIYLLHLKTRIPAHAMCITATESFYHNEYNEAQNHLRNWKELLGLPQSQTWVHEGNSKWDLRGLCQQHQLNYLITTKETAKKLQANGYFWQRKHTKITKEFKHCVIVCMHKAKEYTRNPKHQSSLIAHY